MESPRTACFVSQKNNQLSTAARLQIQSATALPASIKGSTPSRCGGEGSRILFSRRTPLSLSSPSVRERLQNTDVNTLRHLTSSMEKAMSRKSSRKCSLDIAPAGIKSIAKQNLDSTFPSEKRETLSLAREGDAESASNKSTEQEICCWLEDKENAEQNGERQEKTLSRRGASILDSTVSPGRFSVSESTISGIESLLDGIEVSSNDHADKNALSTEFDSSSYNFLESNPSAKANEASPASPTKLDVTQKASDSASIQNGIALPSSTEVSCSSTCNSPARNTRALSRGSDKKRPNSPFLSVGHQRASNSYPNPLLKQPGQKKEKSRTTKPPTAANAEQKHSVPRNAIPLPTPGLQDLLCDSPRFSAPITSSCIADSPAKNTRSSCGKRCMSPGTPLFTDKSCGDRNRSRRIRLSVSSELALSPSLLETKTRLGTCRDFSRSLETGGNKEEVTANPLTRGSNPTDRESLPCRDRAGRHGCVANANVISCQEVANSGSCFLSKSDDNICVYDLERSSNVAGHSFGDNAALDKASPPFRSEKRKATLDLADFRALFNEETRQDALPLASQSSHEKSFKETDPDSNVRLEPENGDTVELGLLQDLFGSPVSKNPSCPSPASSKKASTEKMSEDENEAALSRIESTASDGIGDRVVSFAAPPTQSPRIPKMRLDALEGEHLTCTSSTVDSNLVPKSILNSTKKKKKGGPFSVPDPLSATKMRTKIVAFGSPVAAEYNKTSPSMSMTPLPASRVKNLFSIPASQSDAESSMSFNTTPVSEVLSQRELEISIESTSTRTVAPFICFAHESTANLESDVNSLLLNAQGFNFDGEHDCAEPVVPTKLLSLVERERNDKALCGDLHCEYGSFSDELPVDLYQRDISKREELTVELEGWLDDIPEETVSPCSKSPTSSGTLSSVENSQVWAEKVKTSTPGKSSDDDQTLELEENLGSVLRLGQTEFTGQNPAYTSTSLSLSDTPTREGRHSESNEDKLSHADRTLELELNVDSLLRVNQSKSKNQTFLPNNAPKSGVAQQLRDPPERFVDGSAAAQFEYESSFSGGLFCGANSSSSRPDDIFEATRTLESNLKAVLAGDNLRFHPNLHRAAVDGSSDTFISTAEASAALEDSAITPLTVATAKTFETDEENTRTSGSIEYGKVDLKTNERNVHMAAIGTPYVPTNLDATNSVAFSARSSARLKRLSLGTPRKFIISPSGSVSHSDGIFIDIIAGRDNGTSIAQMTPNAEKKLLNLTYQEFIVLTQTSMKNIGADSLMTSSKIVNSACNPDVNGQIFDFLENVSSEVEQRSFSLKKENENRFRLGFHDDSLPSTSAQEHLFSFGSVREEDFQKQFSDIVHIVSHQLPGEWHQWEKCVTNALIENVVELVAESKQLEGVHGSMAFFLRKAHASVFASSNNLAKRARTDLSTKVKQSERRDTFECDFLNRSMFAMKVRSDEITVKNRMLSSCLQLTSVGKKELLDLSHVCNISKSREIIYKVAQELLSWSLVQTQATNLTISFDSQRILPCAQLIVPFDSEHKSLFSSVVSVTKDRHGVCSQFMTHYINHLQNALRSPPRASPAGTVQHVNWGVRRGELIVRELKVLLSIHTTILERIDPGTISLTIDFNSRDDSKKLRVGFYITESYPNTTMEVFLQPLHGDGVQVESLSRHLRKTARPGFGYISRSCEVIKAFLS